MKNKLTITYSYYWKGLFLMLMRIFTLLLCTTVFSFNIETGLAQEKVTIYSDQVLSVDEVFDLIINQTEYSFIYPADLFSNIPKIDLKKGEMSVDKLLQHALPLEKYNVVLGDDGRIAIKEKVPIVQQLEISGTVTDEKGIPLLGVNIIIEGLARGTSTDFDGNYTINVEIGQSLRFSSIGFEDQVIKVESGNNINVVMTEGIQLAEAVVTALGFRRDADDLGYSTSQVKGNSISESKAKSLIDGLAGKASGVTVRKTDGDPGSGSFMQIRGASTIGNSQPLIVLDGVPIDNSSEGGEANSVSQQSRLNDLNPEDIEDVTILKGASAAALWGSRASNGVIMIETKKGRRNSRLNVTFQSSYSFSEILKKHALQSEFGQGDKGVYNQNSLRSWGDYIPDRLGGEDIYDPNGAFFRATNGNEYYTILEKRSRETFQKSNFDQIIRTGQTLTNSINLSGGDDKSQYFVSLSNDDQKGIMGKNSDYVKTSLRVNASRQFNDYVNISSNTTYITSSSNRVRRGNASSGIYIPLLRTPPDFDITDYEGEYFSSPTAAPIPNRQRVYRNALGQSRNPGFNNPFWTIHNQINYSKVNRFISSLNFQVTPVDWLEFILRGGVDTYTDERDELFKVGSVGGLASTGKYVDNIRRNTEMNADFIMRVIPNLKNENWKTEGILGFNINERSYRYLGATAYGFIDPSIDLKNFINTSSDSYELSNTRQLRRNAALYGKIDLSYKNYLFAELTGRYEVASTFGEEAKSGFFYPSITTSWQFHKNLDVNPDFLSFGKLRASYAIVGVEPALYRTISNYVSADYNDASSGGDLDASKFGNGGFVPSVSVGNPFLKPEEKSEFETGVDLRFINNRLRTSFTYYNNKTTDVLFDVPIAASTGYTRIQDNAGEIKNYGFEVDLGYDIIMNRDFSWSIGLLWNKNRNEVSKLPDTESLNLGGLSEISSRAVQGYQLGVLWGSRWERESNGSLALDANGFPLMSSNMGVIGDPNPTWEGSLNTQLKYKNFSFYVVFQTTQGNDIFAGTLSALTDYGLAPETANFSVSDVDLPVYGGGIIPRGETFRGNIKDFGNGPVALDENWYRGPGGYFSGPTEAFVVDGSSIRLQQITLSYSLNSQKFREWSKMQSVDFSITGSNLYVWSKFKGNDPSTNLSGATQAQGIDYFNNPATKTFNFTLRINL